MVTSKNHDRKGCSAEDLAAENEKLRLLVSSLEHERRKLVEKVQMTDDVLREHDAMRDVVSKLEQSELRLQSELLQLHEEYTRREEEGAHLRRRLVETETQNRRFSEENVEAERRNNNLTNLYVASYRLHGTLDRSEVLDTIQEIVANLVGCEEQGIFEVTPESPELRLIASVGIDRDSYDRIRLGEGVIGRAALDGEAYVAPANNAKSARASASESGITACIPLKLNGRVTGAIALFRLLPQKPDLAEVDHELFDLLTTHAATALYCTTLLGEPVPSANVEP